MIISEFYKKRSDGVNLYRTYSNKRMMIKKSGTDEMYSEAIDIENSGFSYIETDIPINPSDDGEITLDDALDALSQLGVDVNEKE